MKKSLALAAALALGASSAAMAANVSVLIDDFAAPPNTTVVDPDAAAGVLVGNYADAIRTVVFQALAGGVTTIPGSYLAIGDQTVPVSQLQISNATNRDSTATVSWSILAGLVPVGSTSVQISLTDVGIDHPGELVLKFNNVVIDAPKTLLANTIGQVNFGLTASEIASLSAGGTLSLTINGDPEYDFTMNDVKLNIGTVPEPGMLALLGIAALGGVASAKRRRA